MSRAMLLVPSGGAGRTGHKFLATTGPMGSCAGRAKVAKRRDGKSAESRCVSGRGKKKHTVPVPVPTGARFRREIVAIAGREGEGRQRQG